MPSTTAFRRENIALIDSTNAELLRRAQTNAVHGVALVADVQTAGRGQRGRRWHAAPGDALLMSVGWRFARGARVEGLSLAVGAIVARVARQFAAERITLKWPNDILLEERAKLGGILIETLPAADGARIAVIGIGVNIREPALADFRQIASLDALPPTALLAGLRTREADGAAIIRDALAQSLLVALASELPVFASHGFERFRDEWWAHRAYAQTTVRATMSETQPGSEVAAITGRIVDLAASGALIIDDGRALHTLHSGTLSLRPLTS